MNANRAGALKVGVIVHALLLDELERQLGVALELHARAGQQVVDRQHHLELVGRVADTCAGSRPHTQGSAPARRTFGGYWLCSAGYSKACRMCTHVRLRLWTVQVIAVHAMCALIKYHMLRTHYQQPYVLQAITSAAPSCRGGTLEWAPVPTIQLLDHGLERILVLQRASLERLTLLGDGLHCMHAAHTSPAHPRPLSLFNTDNRARVPTGTFDPFSNACSMHAKPTGMCTHAGYACAPVQESAAHAWRVTDAQAITSAAPPCGGGTLRQTCWYVHTQQATPVTSAGVSSRCMLKPA